MKIVMTRYYGDSSVTKSVLTAALDGGGKTLRCEAREPSFADYREPFPGCASLCLASGTFECKACATESSPMTLTVVKSPGHRCCRFGWHDTLQQRRNVIIVGDADSSVPEAERIVFDTHRVFDRLTKMVYTAFVTGEPMLLEIRNNLSAEAMK